MDTKFQWILQCQSALEHLKKSLCKVPILQYPNIVNNNISLLMQVNMPTLEF